MSNLDIVYSLASDYIKGDNGSFDYRKDHLFGETVNGITFYKVGQDGSVEYFLGVSKLDTLYKRTVKHSFRIHMDSKEYYKLINSDLEQGQYKALASEEKLISEEIIPLAYASQIGFIGKDTKAKSYY